MKKNGFTLVELMVSLLIIGLISTAAIISINSLRREARDTERLGHIHNIQSALEKYYRDENQYPATITPGQALVGSSSNTVYLSLIPQNPFPSSGSSCPPVEYSYTSNASYTLEFCLEQGAGNNPSGYYCLTPLGIQLGACVTP